MRTIHNKLVRRIRNKKPVRGVRYDYGALEEIARIEDVDIDDLVDAINRERSKIIHQNQCWEGIE